jgi:hypothetical protein
LNERLAPADKLTADQKQRLMELVRSQFDQAIERRRRMSSSQMLPLIGTRTEKSLVEHIESTYWQMVEDSRRLVARLPEVLTPNQVAEFSKMEDEKLASQRRYTEERRVAAGLSPQFAESPPGSAPAERIPAAGNVRLEVYFRTNEAEPVQVEYVTENGKPTPVFDVHEGLWVEVTPTLFEDRWVNVDFQFYEERNGQRRLRGKHGWGMQAGGNTLRSDPRYSLGSLPGASTIVSGSKVYSVSMDARVSAAQ